MSAYLKTIIGWLLFKSGLYRFFYRGRAVITLFHRIDDDRVSDSLCCSQRDFRRFCKFFKRYFKVVSLSELLDKMERGEDISRHLVITFDDGYRDNATLAAPILKEYGLPACFFVSSGFLDSGTNAPWDTDRGIRSEWMDWDQVRALARDGFEIGAHTINHIDLGEVTGEAARHEIVESKRRLEEVLETRIDLFSYPFGGVEQCAESNRVEVQRAGFRCCTSAYGGLVPIGEDPFRLQRAPVNTTWHQTPYQYGVELIDSRQPRFVRQPAAQPAAARTTV